MTEGRSVDFLYLSEPDLIRVGAKDFPLCIETCESVFGLVSMGDYIMGGAKHNEHGSIISFPDHPQFEGMPANGPERRFIAMPAYVGGSFHVCGVKWYGSNVHNRELGLPRSILTLELNDPETGAPVAFMSANLISAMRTGCVPAVGARHLTDHDAATCTLIGCGPVNRATLRALACELPGLEHVVVNAAHHESALRCCRWIEGELGIGASCEDDFDAAVAASEVVVIGASPAEPLHIREGLVREGAFVVLNSPVEADDDFWLSSGIVFDNPKMHERYMEEAEKELGDVSRAFNGFGKLYELMEAGKLSYPSQIGGLGDYCLGSRSLPDAPVTVLVTSGQAVLDVAFGKVLLDRARNEGVGQGLRLWDEPDWV